MFRAGAESWRGGIDTNPRLVLVALYVRDACGLGVVDDPSVPPRLLGEIVDHTGDLTPEIRRLAGEQWLSWWSAIVTFEGAQQLGTLQLPGDGIERAEALSAVHESLLDWPDLDVFSDQPALREAVRTSYEDASQWHSEHSREAADARRTDSELGYEGFGSIAEALVDRLRVTPGRLRAGVLVVGVEGDWSGLVVPGVLCCSESTVADSERFRALVEETFISGLDAVEVPLPTVQRKNRSLPRSTLRAPLVLWSGPELRLVCERVIPYPDGFEIELRRIGGTPPTPVVLTEDALRLGRQGDPWQRPDGFAGLEVTLCFSDGRSVLVTDLCGPDEEGEIMLSRFWRKESDANTLWLWAMPLPPEGEVTLTVTWPAYAIESAVVGFEASLVRRARAG